MAQFKQDEINNFIESVRKLVLKNLMTFMTNDTQ